MNNFNVKRHILRRITKAGGAFAFVVFLLAASSINAQVTFAEDCFVGGVQTGGHRTIGSLLGGSFNIKWEEGYSLRRAYAICYRYGRPEPHTFFVNGGGITWNAGNQAGPELPEENGASNYFATHAVDITDAIAIDGDVVNIDLPLQTFYDFAWNWGWWGAYIVLLYESPDITTEVCTRIYIADQSQDFPQNYTFEKPQYDTDRSLLFSIYSDRLTSFESDASEITINSQLLGNIWSPDPLSPISSSGVQGHFFYQNGVAEGLNGDTANTQVYMHDGIAVINDYLVDGVQQSLNFTPVSSPNIGFNVHPAFLLTYSPDCQVVAENMPRQYAYCLGDSVQLSAISGYDNYSWSCADFLSDSTTASPWCSADSSQWYTVRMWNDNGNVCPQTIPVHITVNEIPLPNPLIIRASLCPNNTGEVTPTNTPGNTPITYSLSGESNTSGSFEDLAPGAYNLNIETAAGCVWDTTLVVPLNPIQEANFTATPETGFTPLDVLFNNTSTQATDYQWLIDGVPVSESEDITYTFPDSGSFEVSLIAYRLEETCADTATFILRVGQGIELMIPNIITPNGDGLNDELVARLFGVESLSWRIFDRWGVELANGNASAPQESVVLWNPSDEVIDGTYFIVIVGFGMDGNREELTTSVTLSR